MPPAAPTPPPEPPREGPLSEAEYAAVYARVPRLTVEVLVASAAGVLLTKRRSGPCRGLWHIPGGTVRFGERLEAAVRRVAADELDLDVQSCRFVGYIEYPSHLARVGDWPVGLAFRVEPVDRPGPRGAGLDEARWFSVLPVAMHDEQRAFLVGRGLADPPDAASPVGAPRGPG